MKNLFIYISPTGSFDNPRADLASNDGEACAKVQIDNLLDLGRKPEDILLITNFEYEYRGIRSTVLNNVDFFERKPQVSKINAIIEMFDRGMIQDDELYWFQDLDAFQLEPVMESEIDVAYNEIGCTDFGGAKFFLGEERWSGGIFVFRKGSKDLFEGMKDLCYKKSIDEEEALGLMVVHNPSVRERVKRLNNSYNFIGYNLESVYEKSVKPIRVVHFHPNTTKKRFNGYPGLDYFTGNNPMRMNLVTDRVVELIKKHGLV